MSDPEHGPIDPPVPLPQEIAPAESVPADELWRRPTENPRVPLPQAELFPAWSGWDLAAVLGFTVAAVAVFGMLAVGVAQVATSKQHVPLGELATNTIVVVGSQIVAYPVVILFMVLLVRSKSRAGFWQAIRWNWPGTAAPAFLISGMAFALMVDFISRYLPIPKSLPVDKYFSDITGAYLMLGFGITLAPLVEELLFRGMLYPLVRRAAGVTAAVLVTATTFAFIHGAQLGYAWAPLLSIFVVSVVFTLVRERTGSVAASFLVHCGYNLALFGALWVGSGHFRHLEKVTNSGCYR